MSRSVLAALALIVLGAALGVLHARAWELGRRAPVLSFDAAQYAVAARELATHGRLATTFALPIDLVAHSTPPWPLSVVQPGLVVLEAVLDRIVPARLPGLDLSTPERREWLPLVISFGCYLVLGVLIARVVRGRLEALDPEGAGHEIVGFAAGAAFLLDPEAQHLALGGFTELPYTVALVVALAMLASGPAARRPLMWGLLLGAAALVRGNLAVLVPVLAIAVAAVTPNGRRLRAVGAALAGYLVVVAPWWIYKWRAFGTPTWDLSTLALWDGVGHWTWFSLTHRPEFPDVALDTETITALATKLLRNFGSLVTVFATGVPGVSAAVLFVALVWKRGRPAGANEVDDDAARAARVTVAVILIHAAIALAVATVGAGWRRYLFPARVPLEAAGIATVWLVLSHRVRNPARRPVMAAVLAGIVLGWGVVQTVQGEAEARAAATARGLPSVATLRDLSEQLDQVLAPGEVVMSNLGPSLAWFGNRPVVHLALAPGDVAACRQRVPFRLVVLAFRDPSNAWGEWAAIVARPTIVWSHLEWRIRQTRSLRTDDGFIVVFLDLLEK